MYNCEKSKKNPQNLSFSSTVLDEIYRSIDGGGNESFDEFTLHRSRQSNERSKSGVTSLKPNRASRTLKEEEEEEEEKVDTHSFRRNCVSEKVKAPPCRRHSQPELYRMSREVDFDPVVPFSSSSSSSDSSSGGLSSSDVEFINVAKSRVSCFTVLRPKPVKSTAPSKTEKPAKVSHYQSDGTRHPFDEMPEADGLIKSKLRTLKIYNSLKKAKQQPISPGSGRLTSFLNSLFSNNGGNPKKTKNPISSVPVSDAETTQPSSTCSSASSYYRSCLTTKEKTNEKFSLGEKKTKVRFDNNAISNRDSQPTATAMAGGKIVDVEDDDELSDSSSDLFELDHLAMDNYGEELPVYETTHVHIGPNGIVR